MNHISLPKLKGFLYIGLKKNIFCSDFKSSQSLQLLIGRVLTCAFRPHFFFDHFDHRLNRYKFLPQITRQLHIFLLIFCKLETFECNSQFEIGRLENTHLHYSMTNREWIWLRNTNTPTGPTRVLYYFSKVWTKSFRTEIEQNKTV